MPKRPRSHELEDLSRNCLHEVFTRRGWTVENLAKDYGEDLLIRIFSKGSTTPLSFFVQAKATDKIDKFLNKTETFLVYPVRHDHLKHWGDFWQPVILTVWDSKSNITYWECIQTFCETTLKRDRIKHSKSIGIRIPVDNKLNQEGLARIEARTRARFKRFARERDGAEELMRILKDEFGLEVEYDPQFGFLSIPEGRFVPDPSGQAQWFFFGRAAAQIKRLQERMGKTSDEIVRGSLLALKQVADAFSSSGKLVVRDSHGNLKEEWPTWEALHRHLERESELDEEVDE
jgi:hypothetical protein